MSAQRTRGTRLRALVSCLLLLPAPLLAQPASTPNPTAQRDSIVARARAQLGTRYRLGGEKPETGFDCSGLIRYVLGAFDLRPPRTSALMALFGQEVPRDTAQLRVGDLLTFGFGNRVSHIGIYIGNGRYVHASSGSGKVVESSLARSGAKVKPWIGVRRLLSLPDSSTVTAAR
jgi:cell wall-associated NlpC family hydrolase